MTALLAAVTAKDRMLRLDGPYPASYGDRITLEGEALTVVDGGGSSTISVWRAQNGTTAAAHAAGTVVEPVWYGQARWPVQVPATGGILGTAGQKIEMPAAGSIVFTAPGGLFFMGLPTVDPRQAGRVWSNKGVLTVSAG